VTPPCFDSCEAAVTSMLYTELKDIYWRGVWTGWDSMEIQ